MLEVKMNPEGFQLMRSALGRVGFVGELYDIRSESFTSRSVFKSDVPSNFIKTICTTNTSFDYKFTENISDRFDLLNVEAEIQVSLLCGLFEAKGCGKFLSHEKKSANNISCSLICRFQTICEKLFASFEEMINHLDLSALADPQYTHVIVEINWGANCVLNFEKKYDSESHKKEIEGFLGVEVKKLSNFLSIQGKGGTKYEDGSRLKQSDVQIKVVADVFPEGELPTTIDCFCDFLAKIPDSLKKLNDGKGKPLNYLMIPINAFRKVASVSMAFDTVVKGIDESFIISVVCLFEEISLYKQKLYDIITEMCEYQNYLPDCEIINGKNHLESLKVRECQLKDIFAENWFSVRSGQKSLRDLIRNVERFKSCNLMLYEFEDYLNSVQHIRKKISTLKNYMAHGAEYLEKEKLFVGELQKSIAFDFIVLVVSSDFEAENFTLFHSTSHYFLTIVDKNSSKIRYVVVDLDLDISNENQTITNRAFFSKLGIANVRCLQFKEGQLLYPDLYGNYILEKKMNFARLKEESRMENVQQKPGKRVVLEISCPGFRTKMCSSNKLKWNCLRCKESLEFGFDDYFYCSCGRQKTDFYEYRCSHDTHGVSFLSADKDFLANELSTLRPLKELNILILGQSGVGKSTWINSIVNYLNYESLEEAKSNGVICTIPIKFSIYNRENSKRQDIEIGGKTNDEITESGKSGTQFCITYSFLWEDRYVRIIDTPGIGDTRGIHQDKENIKHIIDHVCNLKELHCICILMKANDSRINAIFSYCLKELLIHMHKSIAKNIVFCFTNARNSFYTPGQTSVLLEKQLESLGVEKELSLGHHNRFCLDNEAFLFLCSLQHPDIHHDEILIKSFAQSWEISLNETLRLFTTVKDFRPHLLSKTRSLFTARNRILLLSRPIAEISKTIQMNLTAIARRKQELDLSEKTIEELSKKLYVNEIHLEPIPLKIPRTVCTSSKCVEYHKIEGLNITDIEYVMHCHEECYIKEVVPRAINNALLMYCNAMNRQGNCTVCGCNWRNHMHITFAQKRIEKQGINRKIETDMLKEKSDKEEIEEFVRTLEEKIAKYEKEQDFIIQVSVKFGMFLRENAISVVNDAVSDYLKYLINEEESKPHKTKCDEELLNNLKVTLDHYEAEVKILQEVVDKSRNQNGVPSIEEIYDLEEKLYALELSGMDIKKYAEANRLFSSNMSSYKEKHLRIPNHKSLEEKKPKEKPKRWKFF